ncbi:hypothetical protein CARUB_v10018046mg [Capsella rubella]|uniref:Uncharacterized protein n=1 Tax=Capsella rubella TaxID=81985 RepID=R0FQD7_9BRAS|nr:uncharacterized protein LOC17885784 [Capsella rubella]EOA24767.1 hypothetical protein CARUB_v10018046mg [Capsella rubella]
MSSVCGGLDFKDAESHLESSSASSASKCSNGAKHVSCPGSDDAQESDGDDSSGFIHQNVIEEAKDIPESLPLISLDDETEDRNLATALQDMFSESMSVVTLIPAIKGGREKHGKSLKKLSVTWAEDVYDPPPSIVSHTRSKKQQPQKSKSKDNLKKNGKKGQKGSSNSRGSKDKKQTSSRSSKYNRDKFDWTTQVSIIAASS